MATIKFAPQRKQATQAGLGSTLCIALLDHFDSLKEAPTTGTAAGDTATITDTHTFKTVGGKAMGFIKIPLMATNTGKYDMKSEGEFPSEKTVSSFEGVAVGLSAEQVEWIRGLKGQNCIVLVRDAECGNGRFVQIGCDCKPVESLKFEWSSEDNKLKIMGKAECELKDYKGVITEMTY